MTPERWQQVENLYHLVLKQEPSSRAAFLKEACAGDEALRREVESLLAQQKHAESFIETPAVEVAAKGMVGNPAQSFGVEKHIGPYRVLTLLGVGGMGEVYLAYDPRLERNVALKILSAELASDAERIRRFVREAKAASALKHPNVATIYEIGESDGLRFIAMEYVEGQTLATKVSGRPLNADEIVEIGLHVADALEEARSKGITHRDIKPVNIMLTPRGQVKVLDFGLAKVTRPEGQASTSDVSTVAHRNGRGDGDGSVYGSGADIGERSVRLARELDPLSLVVQTNLLGSLIGARQFDEAIAQAHRTLEREPNFAFGYASLALAYGEKGEFEQAIEAMEKATKIESSPTMTALTAHVQAAKGNRREAEKLLEALKAVSSRRYVCAYEMAHAYVKLGDKKQAFEWLEKGKQDRADCMVWLLSEPWMDPLRGSGSTGSWWTTLGWPPEGQGQSHSSVRPARVSFAKIPSA